MNKPVNAAERVPVAVRVQEAPFDAAAEDADFARARDGRGSARRFVFRRFPKGPRHGVHP